MLLARKQTAPNRPAKYTARLVAGVLMFGALVLLGIASVVSRVYAADPPIVSSVSPSSGSVSGGDSITITGTGFASGATVKLGMQLASSVSVLNDTTITAVTPASQASTVDVVVTNPDSLQGKLSDGFSYLGSPPTVSTITPDSGPESGGTNVTITGTNFTPPNSTINTWTNTSATLPGGLMASQTAVIGDTIYMFGGQGTNVIYSAPVSDPTSWTNTGKTLPGTYGYASLAIVGDYVYLFGGWSGAGSGNVIYRAPISDPTTWTNTGATLPGVLCTSAVEIIGDTIYLFGGYSAGASSTNVIYSAPVSDPTSWTNTGATLPGNLGYSQSAVIGDTVYLFGGSPNSGSSASNVIYSAPVSNPTSWTNTGKTLPGGLQMSQLVTIGDSIYLVGGRDSNVIYSAPVSNPTSWTNTGKTLPSSLGFSQLMVVNNAMYLAGGNSGPSAGSAIYTAPVDHYRPNQYNKPWITNWGTSKNMVDQSAVSFGGTPATNVSFVSPTQVTATTLGHVPGTADVTVTNYDGQSATLAGGFTYNPAPSVVSLSSASGSVAGGDTITITGTNFIDGATVSFGGVAAGSVQYVNATTLTVTAPAAESGTYDITVTNPDGQTGTLSAAYTYILPAPSLSGVNPATGSIDGGTEVTISGTNLPEWTHRRSFTIDQSKVTGTHTDFPVAITITDNTLRSVANGGNVGKANGGDIKFVLPSGTKLSHEIESYDEATGALVAWVKLPQLTDTKDTLFYMYYGNKTVADQWDANATWNSDYRGVWHFGETSGNVSDSTLNSNTGTNGGSTSAAGKIGNGRSFGGGTYINAGNNASLNPSSKMTLSFWTKPAVTNTDQTPMAKWTTGAGANNAYGITLGQDAANNGWGFTVQPSTGGYVGIFPPATTYSYTANEWSHMVGVADGSFVRTYKDGVEIGTPVAYNGTLKTDSVTDLIIGRLNLGHGGYTFSGIIDEPKLMADSVSSDWIATEYTNQNDPSTFYSVGADETLVTVNFGGVSATNVVGGSGALLAIAPANPEGQVNVSVTTIDNQTDTLNNAYTYYDGILVSGISPSSGSTAGGDSVTIIGAEFAAGATVRFGNIAATNVNVVNDTTITATTPAHEAHAADVIVVNPDGQVGTLTDGYTYTNPAPSITNINPASGSPAGGTSVTITGTGFFPENTSANSWTDTGATLPVNNNYASIAVVGDTIYRYGGQSSNAILSAPASDPTNWTNTGKTLPGNKGGAQLAIVGDTMYLFGGYTSSSVGSVTASIYSASIADPTTWTDTGATLPGGRAIGQLAIVGGNLYWYGGSSNVAPTGVIYSAPVSDPTNWTNTGKSLPISQYNAQIAVVGDTMYLYGGTNTTNRIFSASTSDPTTWTNTGATLPTGLSGSQLLIIGETMYLLGGTTSAIFSASTSDPTTWTNTGQTLPASLTGSQVAAVGNTAYLFGGSSNAIYSTSLNHYRPNQYNKPWITNWATDAANDQSTVTFDGIQATNVELTSTTEITATTPAHATGSVDVVVQNYDGLSTTLSNGYTYLSAIAVDSIMPNNGAASGGDSVTITGSGFETGATVTFGGISATNVGVVNSTTITATTPAHGAGLADVTVTNLSTATATLANGYRFNGAPQISSISPSSGDITGGNVVTITGSNFYNPDVAAIESGGTPSANGNMPERLTYAFDSDESTVWGSNWNVEFPNPSVTSTFNQAYEIGHIAWKGCFYPGGNAAPRIYLRQGGSWVQYTSHADSGTGDLFLATPVTADAIMAYWPGVTQSVGCNTISAYTALPDGTGVTFGGTPATNVEFVNETTIRATAPAHARGAVDVVATMPDGQVATSVDGYTYTDFPSVSSISPTSGSVSGGTAITITGNNFKSGDTVAIGGVPVTDLVIVDNTTITAVTPANTPGPADVTVTDPDNNTATLPNGFTYTALTPTISSFSPAAGLVEGGTEVTITGTNFDPGYVRQVTITNNTSTNYTNYPVELTVDTAALIAAGRLRSDCGDLRIKASNKTTNLPYNVASGCNTSSTEIWVQLPTLSGNSSATIYLTYGYGSLTGSSSPDDITTPPDSNIPTVTYGSEQRIMSVTFGGVQAAVSSVTPTTITVTTPEHSAANVSVTATNFYGPSATAPQQFKYVPSAYAFTNVQLVQAATQPGELVLEPRDSEGNPITAAYDITFNLDSTSSGGLFATTENGSYGINTITLPAGQPSVSFFYKDSNEGGPTITATGLEGIEATQGATITSKYRLLVTGISSPVKAGVPSSVTVQAVDYAGQPLADYTGTVTFMSTDSQAVLPANYTFTTDANGQHTFVNAVTMRTVGTWCVTATDTNNAVITGQQCSITVVASDAITPAKLAVITEPQTFAATASSSAITVQAQGADNTPSPVFTDTKVYVDTDSMTGEFSIDGSSNWTSVTPFEVTIPAGVSSVNIFYRDTTAGTPTLTFADTDNAGTPADLIDASQTEMVIAGAPSQLRLEGPAQLTAGQYTPYSATLQDIHGNEATAESVVDVYFTATSGTMTFSADSSGTGASNSYHATVLAGESSAVVYVTDTVTGSSDIMVSDASPADGAAGLKDDVLSLNIVANVVTQIVGVPYGGGDITVRSPSQQTFQFQDIYGNVAPLNTTTSVQLDSTSDGARYCKLCPPQGGWINDPVAFDSYAGDTVTTFNYEDSAVGNPTITASAEGLDPGQIALSIVPGPLHHFGFTPADQTLTAGQSGALEITAYDQWDNVTTNGSDVTINLTSTSANGEFSLTGSPWNPVSSMILPADTSSTSIYYRDTTAGTPTITAVNSANVQQSGADTPTIVGAAPTELYFASSQQVVAASTPSREITIGLKDQYGNPTRAAADFNVTMTSPSASGEFSGDGSSGWSASKTVTFSGGALNTSVYFRDSTTGIYTLTAASDDYTAANQQIQVEPGVVGKISLSAAANMTASSPYPVTVETQTADDVRAAVEQDTTITLSGPGEFSLSDTTWSPITSVVVEQGQAEKQLYFKPTTAGAGTLTAAENPSQGWEDGQTNVNIAGGPIHSFSFTSVPTMAVASAPSDAITVTTLDIYGNVTLGSQDTTVYLYSSQTEGTFATNVGGPWTADSVTIPAGSSGVDFYYQTTKAGTATLTASDHNPVDSPDVDIVNASAGLTITAGAASKLVFVTSPQTVQIGQDSQQIKISLRDNDDNEAAATSALTVNLASTCTTGTFSLIAGGSSVTQLTIPADESDGFFYFKANEIGDCTITVSGTGLTPANQTETITTLAPVPTSLSIDTAPQTLVAGQTSTPITVSFKDAQGNAVAANTVITVSLSSTSSGGTFAPASLTFQPGEMTKTFTYRDTTTGSPVLTASAAGLTSANQTEDITAGTLTKISLTSTDSIVTAGQDATFTVQLQNEYDAPFVATGDTTIYLHSNGSGVITDGVTTISSIVIPSGQSSQSFTYSQTASGSVTLTASDVATPPENPDVGFVNGAKAITIAPDSYYSLNIISGPANIEAGADSTDFVVQAQDQYGNAVPLPAQTPFPLMTTSSTGTFTGTGIAYPGQLTINAGSSTGTFTYRDTTVGTPTITVDGQSGQDATTTVDIVAGTLAELAFINPPARFDRGGVSDPIVIAVKNTHGAEVPVSADLNVYLHSTNASGQFAASTSGPWTLSQVTIPNGSSRATVYYRDDSINPPATLTASDVSTPPENPDTGLTNATTTIANDATDPAEFVLSPTQSIIAAHPSTPFTVSVRDYHGNPTTPLEDTNIYLRSSSNTGEFSLDGVTWGLNFVTLPAGSTDATFYYRDKTDGTPTITASDNLPPTPDTGIVNATRQLTITRQIMDHFRVTNISDPQDAGTPSSVVVSAVDADNYVIDWYAGTISFSSNDPSAILPGQYTFKPDIDKGIHTFTNGVAFVNPGVKSVTVTDQSGKTGTQYDIDVGGANTGIVEQLAFIEPSSPPTLTSGAPSDIMTIQLQDGSGNPIAAGVGGYPVRLTTTSNGGQFATSRNGPWSSAVTTTVPHGASFVNVYYRDSNTGTFTLTGADWRGGYDDPAVANAQLSVIVNANNDFSVSSATQFLSRNALGEMVAAPWFFGHTSSGRVDGTASFSLSAQDIVNGDVRPVDWELAWRNSNTTLDTALYGGAANVEYAPDPIVAMAGGSGYSLDIVATDTTQNSSYSRTIVAPVSPWKAAISPAVHGDSQEVTFTLETHNDDSLSNPANIRVRLLESSHQETGRQLTIGSLTRSNTGIYTGRFDAAALPKDKSYMLHAEIMDGSNTVLADVATDAFSIPAPSGNMPDETPDTEPDSDNGQESGTETSPPAQSGQNDDSETGGNAGSSSRGDSAADGGSDESQSTISQILQAIKRFAQSPAAPVVIPGFLYGLILLFAVVLLRQMYNELRRVHMILAILKREAQTSADKTDFLRLCAHFLRTPITIMVGAAEMLKSQIQNGNLGPQLYETADNLRKKAETVIADTESNEALQDITAPDVKKAHVQMYTSPFFWLPLGMSVLLTLGANELLQALGNQSITNTTIVIQLVAGILIGVVLYGSLRTRAQREQEREQLEEALRHKAQLDEAKNRFIQNAYEKLAEDTQAITLLSHQLDENLAATKSLQAGVRQLLELLAKFQLLSTIDSTAVHASRFDPEEVIRAAVNGVADKAAFKHVTFTPQLEGGLLNQDATLLKQVLRSVLDNAVKFSPDNTPIEITSKLTEEGFVLAVHDHGPGMKENPEEMFEAFKRADDSLDFSNDGAGLSLYLDRLIMRHLGGDITAVSSTANGTEVRLRLPNASMYGQGV